MKKTIQLNTLLCLCIGSVTSIYAQEAALTAGGNASGSGGSVSYNLGQVLYTTNTGANGFIVQGVQQPYEISVVTGLAESDGIHLKLTAYPNPATDFLIVSTDNPGLSALTISLYTISGKLIKNITGNGNETKIDMTGLVPALYFLKVTQNDQNIKTFRIIKK